MMPQLCQIKELKANLDAAWNHRGDKFCVGASSGHVYTGAYDQALGFWIALAQDEEKPLHEASVVCVRFDPLSSRVVASCSADGTVVISTSYFPDLDAKSTDGPFGKVTTADKFDTQTIFKFKTNSWANSLSFSPRGDTLVFASKFRDLTPIAHDSTLHFYPMTEGDVEARAKPSGSKVTYMGAPVLTGNFISEEHYVGSGFDKTPILFSKQGKDWAFTKFLDEGIDKKRPSKIGKDAFGGKSVFFDGLNLSGDVEVTEKDTKHVNYINC